MVLLYHRTIMEFTNDNISNIILIIMLIFPFYSFIKTLYVTYSKDMIGKMVTNLIVFLFCFLIFIILYQFLWLPNRNSNDIVMHIIKISTILSFIPSVIFNFKSISKNNEGEGLIDDNK